jgi:N-acetyltransferase
LKTFEFRPNLENDVLKLIPLDVNHFDDLFNIGSDPLIWEQHPNPLRYQRDMFQNYFDGAIASKGAFLILHAETGEIMGSSRYYDLKEEFSQIKIGYTFLARKFWGGKYNGALKKLMLSHAFQFADTVIFEIGSKNIRSQIAIERIGGEKILESEVTYFGENSTLNFTYAICKSNYEH